MNKKSVAVTLEKNAMNDWVKVHSLEINIKRCITVQKIEIEKNVQNSPSLENKCNHHIIRRVRHTKC